MGTIHGNTSCTHPRLVSQNNFFKSIWFRKSYKTVLKGATCLADSFCMDTGKFFGGPFSKQGSMNKDSSRKHRNGSYLGGKIHNHVLHGLLGKMCYMVFWEKRRNRYIGPPCHDRPGTGVGSGQSQSLSAPRAVGGLLLWTQHCAFLESPTILGFDKVNFLINSLGRYVWVQLLSTLRFSLVQG